MSPASPRNRFAYRAREAPYFAASLLAANPASLGDEAGKAQAAGCDWLHIDVMDGHFVPNMAFAPRDVAALRDVVHLPLDVHLMVQAPLQWAAPFAKAGADLLTFHLEASCDIRGCIDSIRVAGARVGISLRPDTPVQQLLPWLPWVDLVLVMSVRPGFGGQAFLPQACSTLELLRSYRQRHQLNYLIEVDGGVDRATAPLAWAAGADALVAGTALFASPDGDDYRAALASLRHPCQTRKG